MATPSTMLPLGTAAPAFGLPDVTTGETVSLEDFAGTPALLVTFICRHCPYVQHVKHELVRLARDYHPRGVSIVGISSNDVATYPDDAPDRLAEMVREEGFGFPLLYDETQEVARAYEAVCTPDNFLFDSERRLVYHGQLDSTRPGGTADGRDIRAALDALLAGRPLPEDQRPSVGCSIKWRQS